MFLILYVKYLAAKKSVHLLERLLELLEGFLSMALLVVNRNANGNKLYVTVSLNIIIETL